MIIARCAYYREISTGRIWVIWSGAGDPLAAVGPIVGIALSSPAKDHQSPMISAAGWKWSDFERVGGEWNFVGSPRPRPADVSATPIPAAIVWN